MEKLDSKAALEELKKILIGYKPSDRFTAMKQKQKLFMKMKREMIYGKCSRRL